jgi:putative ABC transport system substrate-binding protein
MRRRVILGTAAVVALGRSPGARGQSVKQVPRIGVLTGRYENDADLKKSLSAFSQALAQAGWIDGRNVKIDYRFGAGNASDIRRNTAEMVASKPDIIVVSGSSSVGPLLQETRTVPVVFMNVPDPVGAGLVDSLARPGGNATGFTNFEYGQSAKWLELLKEIDPRMTRVAVLRDSALASGTGQFGAIQAVTQSRGVEATPLNLRDAADIERSLSAFAQHPHGGMILTPSAVAFSYLDLILATTARLRLPAIYSSRVWADRGGLMSYGANGLEQFRGAAGYVDRILKGAKAAELPVQAPTAFELVINVRTAKTLGLTAPPTLLARADEVIE